MEKIALFTLPDLGVTPEIQALGPAAVTLARELDVLNNTAMEQLAASNPNVQLVDIFKLSDAVAADPLSFGFTDATIPMINLIAAGATDLHPMRSPSSMASIPLMRATASSAFADAVLT